MQASAELLKQAKAAVDRAEIGFLDLSSRLKNSAAGRSRAHRIAVENTTGELARLLTVLTVNYSDMVLAPKGELPALWRRFYVCYDEYLEAARLARTWVMEDSLPGPGAASAGALPPAEGMDSK